MNIRKYATHYSPLGQDDTISHVTYTPPVSSLSIDESGAITSAVISEGGQVVSREKTGAGGMLPMVALAFAAFWMLK